MSTNKTFANRRNVSYIVTYLLCVSTFGVGCFLASSNVLAASSQCTTVNGETICSNSATASVTVPSACTLSVTGGGVYTTELKNGQSKEIPGSTIKIMCNDSEGFALYAVGYSNDEFGNNQLINAANLSQSISTGINGPNSYWSMRLSSVAGPFAPTIEGGFDNKHSIPTAHEKAASFPSQVSAADGASVSIFYEVGASATQAAGTYSGKVKYTVVHPANETPISPQPTEAGKIAYYPNSNNTAGQMGEQSTPSLYSTNSITAGTNVTLWASNYKLDGYGFAGWNDKYDYTGNNYGPNQTIVAPEGIETNGLSLYAKWIKSTGSMQTFTNQKCQNMNTNDVTALTDERDGNTYAVARLADGKCWMIENLRLDNTQELSSNNTHNPLLPLINYGGGMSNYLSDPVDPIQNAWCENANAACINQSMLTTNNTTNYVNNLSGNQQIEIYSYGNYYNWYSATAGHGKYGDDYGNGYVAAGDVCPSDWHLPTGNSVDNEYAVLDIAMGGNGAYQTTAAASNRWRSYPYNFIFSGNVMGSSVSGGSSGMYWSSLAANINYARALNISSTSVGPANYMVNKYVGAAVRCVYGM